MTRHDTRTCTVCGQDIEPGDVAEQRNGRAMHWDCDDDVTGVPA